ncbi:hypothetical protein [Paenibacillus oryzisoli]|uniref:Uncharacterized protein n=1 Tax=Paenibacillus oryzisoli TaxID=1850517 RepID=A0A198AI60_9BACL|nr:hypothetical protein [Paenibacillus oryzisoli]OAS21194.1 hypothetical protein A8708_30380 [Paenibacillus oryzisoli]
MKKQPQITEQTNQKFVEVFCESYSQKPIEKISVQEIANKELSMHTVQDALHCLDKREHLLVLNALLGD